MQFAANGTQLSVAPCNGVFLITLHAAHMTARCRCLKRTDETVRSAVLFLFVIVVLHQHSTATTNWCTVADAIVPCVTHHKG